MFIFIDLHLIISFYVFHSNVGAHIKSSNYFFYQNKNVDSHERSTENRNSVM